MPQLPGSWRSVVRQPFLADRAAAIFERFLHIEALSGVVLLLAAAAALVCANTSLAHWYEELWHLPLSVGLGTARVSQSLHFWINDGLMTVFFLVVGMEIRREMHEGSLSDLRQAALPVAAAAGGVIVPALVFLAVNQASPERNGWAVPTATDIAFAVGILALLGKGIPRNIRIMLLALAIIDDIIAVLIIALFYSDGLSIQGYLVAALGVLLVLAFRRAGIGWAWAYLLPGALVWGGLLMSGTHPTLAGVVLGLMTPMQSVWKRDQPEWVAARIARSLAERQIDPVHHAGVLANPLRELSLATREILPPAVRVQMALHPWVAYGVMPLFAFANAGVAVQLDALPSGSSAWITIGVVLALVLGKPAGVIGAAWAVTRLKWCKLPAEVSWSGVVLVGLLTGIGFTMAMFIAMLAYTDPLLLDAAKLGVLLASCVAAILGLGWGTLYLQRRR
jgi:NhaA family Na+:H+ antiporter